MLAAAAFIGVAILRWPLLLVLAVLAPIGMAWYWPREAKTREEDPLP
jgi:chromate transporter